MDLAHPLPGIDTPARWCRRLRRGLVALLVCAGLGACGGGGGGGAETGTPAPPTDPAPPAGTADLNVLMMGNSHTALGDLPRQLAELLRTGQPGRTVEVVVAPGWMFLEERVADAPTLTLLRSRRWSAVVLQAQKYSSSGQFSYSTAEAEALIRMVRTVPALPVLFPEWARFGVDETQRIYTLHTGIAGRQPACVPAIPQAWDLALARHPGLRLHDPDGNHANEAGAQLAALMLYASLTGVSPRGLPVLAGGVDAAVQQQLRQVAGDTLLAHPPRQHCPADAAG
jgi:hypothetical protein